MQTFAVVHHRI